MTMKAAGEPLLRKVKLNNNGSAHVSWKQYYVDESTGERAHRDIQHPGELLIHEDFRAAFAVLNEHWMIRGEEVAEPKASYPFDKTLKGLERVTVTSVTFSGGEPAEPDSGEEPTSVAAHIQGTMRLKEGGVKNFCCPPIKLTAVGEKYKFVTHLDQHLQAIEAEVWDYVAGTKFTPPKEQQLAMDLSANPGEPSADVNAIGAGDSGAEEEGGTGEEAVEAVNTTPESDGEEG